MTAPNSPDPADSKPKIDLKATQVAGAALGAVTAAVAGSRLGTAGTLVGAAGASMVYTVTSAVYRTSLERSRMKVRALAQRTRPLPISRGRSGTGTWTETGTGELVTTGTHPGSDPPDSDPRGGDLSTDSSARETPGGGLRRFLTLRSATVVVGSVGGFVLAMMLITGFELTSGKTLGGGAGTTVGHVVRAPQGPQTPAGPAAPSTSSVPTSQAPTESAEPTPTTSPTTPPGDSDRGQSPATTSRPPATRTVTTVPPLLPTYLPGPGDR